MVSMMAVYLVLKGTAWMSTVHYSTVQQYSTVQYLDQLVHLVPQLGGGQVVVSGHGGLAGGARHAAELLLVTPSVQQEAHTCRGMLLVMADKIGGIFENDPMPFRKIKISLK